jgi:hypothetical protein
MASASHNQKLYAITIFGYKKEGMGEQEYHDYVSKTHAGHLKALLAQNNIVSYTMVSLKFHFHIHHHRPAVGQEIDWPNSNTTRRRPAR